jgi:hypothetical protein
MIKSLFIIILVVNILSAQNQSFYIVDFHKKGIDNNRPIKAIRNSIVNIFEKSNIIKIKNGDQIKNYIKEKNINVKECDFKCFKDIGMNNHTNHLIKVEVIKSGFIWSLNISIININFLNKPYEINIKSKQGTIKLIAELENELSLYIENSNAEDKNVTSDINFKALKPSSKKTIYYDVPIFADQKCGDFFKSEVINSNTEKSWDGTFYIKKDNWKDKIPLEGTFIEWYSDTLKKNELTFINGVLEKFNHWDKNGKQLIRNGNGYYKEYWYDNILLMEGEVKNGLLNGNWKFYYGGGTTYPETRYLKNNETGELVKLPPSIPDGAIFNGEKIDENRTYPLKLKPEMKNQIFAKVNYNNVKGEITTNSHENWVDFVPDGEIIEMYHINGNSAYLKTESGYILKDESGFVLQEQYIDEEEYKFLVVNHNNSFIEENIYNSKGKYKRKYQFIDGEWKLISCYDDKYECTSFNIEYSFDDDEYGPIEKCDCL